MRASNHFETKPKQRNTDEFAHPQNTQTCDKTPLIETRLEKNQLFNPKKSKSRRANLRALSDYCKNLFISFLNETFNPQ